MGKDKVGKKELAEILSETLTQYPPTSKTSVIEAFRKVVVSGPVKGKLPSPQWWKIYTSGQSPEQMAKQIIQEINPRRKPAKPGGAGRKGPGKKTGTHTKKPVRHYHEEPILNPFPGRPVLSPGIRELLSLNRSTASKDKAKLQHITELETKGANITLIMNAIVFPSILWKKKTGIFDMEPPDFGKADLKREKRIRKALELLTEELQPVFPDTLHGQRVNRKMAKMQADLKAVHKRYEQDLQEYFDLKLAEPYLYDLVKEFPKNIIFRLHPPHLIANMRRKGLKSTKHLWNHFWNESVVVIVDELTSIGYSKNQAYKETAMLLNLFYPDKYKNTNRNLITARYRYHTKNPKGPATLNKTPQK